MLKPEAIHIAECWPVQEAVVGSTSQNGAGFDATQNDGLRDAVRSAIGQASQGSTAFVDMDRIAREIAIPARPFWQDIKGIADVLGKYVVGT